LYRKILTREVGEEWGELSEYMGSPLSVLPVQVEDYVDVVDSDTGEVKVAYERRNLSEGEVKWFINHRLGGFPSETGKPRVGGNVNIIKPNPFDDTSHKTPEDPVEKEIDEFLGLGESSGYCLEDIHMGKITEEEKAYVMNRLEKHRNCFSSQGRKYPNELLPDWTKLHIKVKAGTRPFRSKPYPMNAAKRKILAGILKEQEALGTIRKDEGEFMSSAFLVPKHKPGQWRLIADARKLNNCIEKNAWRIPLAEDILEKLAGCNWFSTMDLTDGFTQIAIDEESQKYTGFTTVEGNYVYTSMPQGLAVSPNHFQYVMDRIFNDLRLADGVYFYIDDLCVYSNGTLAEHMDKMDKVMERCGQFGLRVKATKCHIACKQVKFLGHVITRKGLSADPEKTQAIQNMPVPTSISLLRGFLGLCSFYRRYIKNFSEMAVPLNDLMKKGRSIADWDDAIQGKAFSDLKNALSSPPVLAYPDLSKPLIIKTDASKGALGAVLAYVDDEGNERVIEYASKTFSKTQRNWDITHRECFAVTFRSESVETIFGGKRGNYLYY